MSEESVRCPNKALVIDRENAHCGYWLCMVPEGHSPEDVLSADYFGFHAGKLKVNDVIEFRSEDLSWYGELLVRAKPQGVNQVVTVERFTKHFDVVELPSGYDARYQGKVGKWTVYRGSAALESGFDTREEAAIHIDKLVAKEVSKRAAPEVAARGKPGPKPKPPQSPEAPPAA